MPEPLIAAQGLSKCFDRRDRIILDTISITIPTGQSIGITGPSGCGKTTLLSILAGLSQPDSGTLTYHLPGEAPAQRLTPALRARHLGIVFQAVHLIPTLSVIENVQIPLFGTEPSASRRHARARAMLERVDLAQAADWIPARLSGGERQRVGVARAFVNDPSLILADEPTGHLDSASAEHVVAALLDWQSQLGRTLVMVTHDAALANRMDRVIALRDGVIMGDGPGKPG